MIMELRIHPTSQSGGVRPGEELRRRTGPSPLLRAWGKDRRTPEGLVVGLPP
ncbi:hypothetical protein ACFWYA_22710 [Streptomyces sp. NPDC059011]|uniref:hypothetical protein n=1 Tax=unclassified Streptomyces TaxID=2593676 RepID=UPI00368E89EF